MRRRCCHSSDTTLFVRCSPWGPDGTEDHRSATCGSTCHRHKKNAGTSCRHTRTWSTSNHPQSPIPLPISNPSCVQHICTLHEWRAGSKARSEDPGARAVLPIAPSENRKSCRSQQIAGSFQIGCGVMLKICATPYLYLQGTSKKLKSSPITPFFLNQGAKKWQTPEQSTLFSKY